MHFCTYQKTLIHTLFCLFLKSSKAFSVSLTGIPNLTTVSSYIYFTVYFSQKMVKISFTYFQIHFSRDFLLSPMRTLVNIFFWIFQTQSQSYSHYIIVSVLVVQYTHYLIVSKTLHSSFFFFNYCCERI